IIAMAIAMTLHLGHRTQRVFCRSRVAPGRWTSVSMWPHGKRTSRSPEADGAWNGPRPSAGRGPADGLPEIPRLGWEERTLRPMRGIVATRYDRQGHEPDAPV